MPLRRTAREKLPSRLVRRPRATLASSPPGGVGAPPGGTTASCQELADVGRLGPSPDMMLALEWADTVHRQAKEANPRSAKCAARQPMTRLRLFVVKARQRKHAKIAAMERRKARRAARHVHTDQDVAPTGAPSPLFFAGEGNQNEAQPARHDKRAAERCLFLSRPHSNIA